MMDHKFFRFAMTSTFLIIMILLIAVVFTNALGYYITSTVFFVGAAVCSVLYMIIEQNTSNRNRLITIEQKIEEKC